MAAVGDKNLYGSERESRKQALQLAKSLQSSTVLGAGEYNYTYDKLRDDVWQSSCSRDFPGLSLDRHHTIAGVTQLNEHFRLGNDSGKDAPTSWYNKSTTADDFTTKKLSKPSVLAEDRTVHWPDMAPQYQPHRGIGESEYSNTFAQQRSLSAPVYPKVKTAVMTLPLDPARFHKQRGSEYKFGNDERSKVSESQRAFGRVSASEDFTEMLASGQTEGVRARMKALEKVSNVFRTGDYNGAAGNTLSTTVNDFGPRTRAPGDVTRSSILKSAKSDISGKRPGSRPVSDLPNMLTSYARANTVPAVFSEAADGRDYQTTAHFKYGSSEEGPNSVYAKDFALSAMANRAVPMKAQVPDAGHMLQNDPEFSNAARSLKSSDFMAPPRPLVKITDNNAGTKYVDHVNVSLDPTRHAADRQKSVAHSDYNKHPANYHPIPPFVAKAAPYRYLETDNALAYPGLDRGSEAGNNYTNTFMQGLYALDRRRQKEDACKNRASNTKSTHFVVGYATGNYVPESTHQFAGRPKGDAHVAPAGKREVEPKSKFEHLGQSINTRDLRHNDPYMTSTKEGIWARMIHQRHPTGGQNPFQTSIMKEDYKDLNRRGFKKSQLRMLEQDEKLSAKPIETSHLFHTDNSGTNQYRSVTMHDFIKPIESTGGRKLLAAR